MMCTKWPPMDSERHYKRWEKRLPPLTPQVHLSSSPRTLSNFSSQARLHQRERLVPQEIKTGARGKPGVSAVSPGSKSCLSAPHASEPCLCGCSLRTKAVLHPRPRPVSRPASRVLPKLSSGKKQLSSPVIVFRAQSSQCSSKPKAKATCQLLPQGKPRAPCNAMPLRKPAPVSVWPPEFWHPLSKPLPEESLHSCIPSQGAMSPVISLVQSDKPQPSLPFLYK
uniref:Uncharacterized protein n=1 Tax=Molossus molossus TaxID=27622 RepID=A0A7J8GQN6_MOLMO|nr:hypothetical protein HJG59_011266 [Molossus molossus]